MTEDTYRTIQSESKGVFKDKGSKFLAFAYRVNNEDEIKQHIQLLKKNYHDARHHCYAYRIGSKNPVYRMNDDGEPSGTAGKQIYGQILSYGLTNILIVVVRYFGGTLLGTSGLINAYRNAAKDCLEKASTIDEVLMKKLSLRFTYDQMNSVLRLLKEESAIIDKQNFEADCIIEFRIRELKKDRLTKRLSLLSNVMISEMIL